MAKSSKRRTFSTDRQVAAFKPKEARYDVPEAGRTGLWIRVNRDGSKTWSLVYRFDGRLKRMRLGSYPDMPLTKAHTAASAAKDKLRLGVDPSVEAAEKRAAERDAATVTELVSEYVERHVKPNMRTADEEQRVLNRDVLPVIGRKKAKDITRRDLIGVLDRIEDRGAKVMRNRTAGVLSRLFKFAVDRGVIGANDNPAKDIRRLPERERTRYLGIEEIHSFWHGLDDIDAIPQVKLALKFLLVTGQRRGEVAGIARAEIGTAAALGLEGVRGDDPLWRLSGERAKNGRENLTPLPPFVMALVEEADRHRVRPKPSRSNRKDRPEHDPVPSPFLFPARIIGKPLEPAALTRAVNRNREMLGIGDATVHDLRRTFATWHGEIGTAPWVLSRLLNHAPSSITDRVYNRAQVIEWKRAAMALWCDWLALVVDGKFDEARAMCGAEVVSIERAVA